MSDTEEGPTERITEAIEAPGVPAEQPLKRQKRPVTLTEAKKEQLSKARAKLEEARKSKRPVTDDTASKQEEIKAWVQGMCKEYLSSQAVPRQAPPGDRKAAAPEPQKVVSKEDYFLSLIRQR